MPPSPTLWHSSRRIMCIILCVFYNRSEIFGTLFRRSVGGEKNYIIRKPVEFFVIHEMEKKK